MTAEQPRVRPGVPAAGQWAAYGHNDNVPGLQLPAAPAGPRFGLTPEYFDPADQAVYDRHESLLINSGIDAAIDDNPVLLGGRTEFVASTDGRRFILGVTDAGVTVHRDPDEVPPDARDQTGFITEAGDGEPTRPDHIADAMADAVRRARFDDALYNAGIHSTDEAEFSGFAVHEGRNGTRTAELTITTAGGSFRLETRSLGPGAEYGVTDFTAGRFLTGRMADAVLLDALEATGQDQTGAEAFVRRITAAAGTVAPEHPGKGAAR